MNKNVFLFFALIFLASAGFVNAYYYYPYDYYSYYYPDYYGYHGYYSYYSYGYPYYYYSYPYYTYPDSYYFYYEEIQYEEPSRQLQPQYCQNPYGSEGQKKCFDSALYICKNGDWLFDRDVQCCQAGDCQPKQLGDFCYFSKSCSNYQCTTGYQQFCPEPGTNKNGICYYGTRDCTASGCVISKCTLQSNQRCDPLNGCVSVPCDESACNSKDGWYCRGGDVTREYRDYYCTQPYGQTCSYVATKRETKADEWVCDGYYKQFVHWSCSNGEFSSSISGRTFCENSCSNGRCLAEVCNVDECNSRDGFYGNRFCRYGDVYRQYRNYYCSDSSCVYSTEDRKIEECYDGCSSGVCQEISCPNKCISDVWYYNGYYSGGCQYSTKNCNSLDSELGARFCKDGDVYVRYRDSFCSSSYGGCDSNVYDKKIQDCIGSCSDGQCVGAVVACESRCDGWSEWTRLNGEMERRQTCYSYIKADGSCVFSKSYTVIQRAPAGITDTIIEKEKSFEFSFDISYSREDIEMTREDVRLYNGLLFGNNEIRFSLEKGMTIGKLTFNVDDKNNYGDLLVYLGSELIYQKNPDIGYGEIPIGETLDSDAELVIKASSSWWRLWAPATFDLSNIALSLRTDVIKTDSFDFEIYQDEYDNFVAGKIQITPTDGFDIFMNGKKISGDKINKADLKVGVNTMEFVPQPGRSYSGKAVVSVFYKS